MSAVRDRQTYLLTNVIDHVTDVGGYQREDIIEQPLIAGQLGRGDIQILCSSVSRQLRSVGKIANVLALLPAFAVAIVTYCAGV